MAIVRGEKAYSHCGVCGKLVQVNKPILGSTHQCLTACERAGRHLELKTRHRGPFWKRRIEVYCEKCRDIVFSERVRRK